MQKIEINNYMKDLLGLPKFSRIDLKQAMETAGIQIGEASLKATLQKLLDDGKVARVGRNAYCIPDVEYSLYRYQYSSEAIELADKITESYPLVDFSVFELVQLNEFLNHQIAHNVIYVSVENDCLDFIFEYLKNNYPGKVLYNPTEEDYHRYWSDNMIVVDKLVSEAPTGINKKWEARIEKILVDIMTSKVLQSSFGESEKPMIYNDVFHKYIIDESCMFRYAKRRGAEEKIRQFIKEETNVKLRLE